MTTRHRVVGTAGHIDHGKSALVRALTGIDPDRLKQEKDRGITIELGFADLPLDEERVVSFVDVPGHERFVRHMVAGATGIDAVVLVVAADAGVQPQTREHLEICKLLSIKGGLVALTKIDLVDDELHEVAELELREFLAGSFLEHAPVIPVSAVTRAGLDELRRALAGLFDTVPARVETGLARLPVDRAFILRGFGTVVTGTLAAGRLSTGQEVEVLPGGARGRIRGIQVHGQRVESAHAGQRTAVNLQGLGRDEVPRGSTLAAPQSLLTTRRIWAEVELLDSAPDRLRKGGPVRFHQGTCERGAWMRVIGSESGRRLRVELRLDANTVLLPGDRFILRRPAPTDTVGGGVVRDIRPPRRAVDHAGATSETDDFTLRLVRAGAGGARPAALAAELGLSAEELEQRGAALEQRGVVVRATGWLFDAEVWATVGHAVCRELERYHRQEPLRPGMPREELRGRACPDVPLDAWRELLDRLATRGELRLDRDRVARATHRVVLSEAERSLSERIESRFQAAGLEPPNLDDVVPEGEGGRAARLVDLLVEQGRLVRIRDGRLFHRDGLEGLRAKLLEYARTSRTIDVPTFKQLAGVTRKNAIPLLEQLDAERRTRRRGNVREILDAPR